MNEEETERIATLMAILYRIVMEMTRHSKRITRDAVIDAMLPYADREMVRKTIDEFIDIGRIFDEEIGV